ncbi:MAG: O-methyltransferase [Firmicutes bacterium]|nr:O-methyltransferase [Bacillota bacterium]
MDRVVDQIEKKAIENNIPIIQKEGLLFITNYIKENNVKHILEIGSAVGYSAIKMALIDENIKITTIERDIDRYNEAVNNIKLVGLDNRISIYNEDALEYIDTNKYDLIFIDAAKAQYIKFFEKYKSNLNNNGVIISDNLKFHGFVENPELTNNRNTKQLARKIKSYIDFLKTNTEFQTTFYELGDGISISKRKNQ